jgi:oligopeptide transport system permease protein
MTDVNNPDMLPRDPQERDLVNSDLEMFDGLTPSAVRTMAAGEMPDSSTDDDLRDDLGIGEAGGPDIQTVAPARSMWQDAWDVMRRRPIFWISAALILLVILIAVFPGWFTSIDPYAPGACQLTYSKQGPSVGHWFGFDNQGCDVYARTIYGARASVLVGTLTAVATALLGTLLGTIAGYLGGWVDALLSRIADVFFAIPLLLGGILIMFTFPTSYDSPYFLVIGKVVFAMVVLGWPSIFRLMRSSVLQVKPNEYVMAARALGAKPFRVVASHIVPNSMAPVIVVSTIDLGSYIATEATLTFLGIGLQEPTISWGQAISKASGIGFIQLAPHMLLFPAAALCVTVLAFIMLGEVVRDALDPKLR